jgi:Flp pilus assembly protein TadG
MAVEVVVLVPVLFAFILLIVAGGRLVMAQGEVDSAARDAARAASIARSKGEAQAAANRAVAATINLGGNCEPVSLTGTQFVAGGQVTVNVQCRVSFSDLGLIGLPGSLPVRGESVAPLDVYRRTA